MFSSSPLNFSRDVELDVSAKVFESAELYEMRFSSIVRSMHSYPSVHPSLHVHLSAQSCNNRRKEAKVVKFNFCKGLAVLKLHYVSKFKIMKLCKV